MLDTYVRRYVNPVFEELAGRLEKTGLTPNQVTGMALVTGVAAGPLIALEHPWAATGLLWFSGLLDALDGQMARRLKHQSGWGTFIDITSDRAVEGAVLIGLAARNPQQVMPLLVLAVTFILSLTVFLTTGALVQNRPTVKSFYYQAGIMERTEGFLAFTALMLAPAFQAPIAYTAALLVLVTVGQRCLETWRLLNNP